MGMKSGKREKGVSMCSWEEVEAVKGNVYAKLIKPRMTATERDPIRDSWLSCLWTFETLAYLIDRRDSTMSMISRRQQNICQRPRASVETSSFVTRCN